MGSHPVEWVIGSQSGSLILFSTIALLSAVTGILLVRAKKNPAIGTALASLGLLVSFLCWAAAGKFIPLTGMLQGTLLLAVPLVFGSMSGHDLRTIGRYQYRDRRSVIGRRLCIWRHRQPHSQDHVGATRCPARWRTHLALAGNIRHQILVDEVILGFVLNVLVIGLTDFLYKKLLIPYQATWNSGPSFSHLEIPLLGKLPIIGPIFFNQTIIVYMMYLIVAAITYALFKTKWGLRTRAVGGTSNCSR
jgi:simple sugar transport system permease protein